MSLKNPWFVLGCMIRVLLLGIPGSHDLNELFIPFLDQAVTHVGVNPWSLSPPDFFPYGSVLFATLFPLKWLFYQIFGDLALGLHFLSFVSIKLPLFLFDLLFFRSLTGWAPESMKRLSILYWLNPVLIYITYVYGQLDVASMALAFLSLWMVTKNRTVLSAVLMACASLCKFHVIILTPLVLLYFWNRNFRKQSIRMILKWSAIYAGGVFTGFLPKIWVQTLDYQAVSSPEVFRLLAATLDFGHDHHLYLGVFTVLLVLSRVALSTRLSAGGLIMGAGAVMSSLICFTDVAPGWFFWPLPFFALFAARYANAPLSLYWSLIVSYFTYFLVLPAWSQVLPGPAQNLIFTFMQFCLIAFTIAIIHLDLRFTAPLLGRSKPMQIGLAGDSSSGKNYFTEVFREIFGSKHSLIMEGDDYHRWERGAREWSEVTHLNPRANRLSKLHADADLLNRGMSTVQEYYDHSTGKFGPPSERRAVRAVFYQGLHTFYHPSLRHQLDLKIFLSPEENLRIAWKLKRDTGTRGHSVEKVLQDAEKRREDSSVHIAPQERFADWVIKLHPDPAHATAEDAYRIEYRLHNEPIIVDLIEYLKEKEVMHLIEETVSEDLSSLNILFTAVVTADVISGIAHELFSPLRHVSRSAEEPLFKSGVDGIHQLFFLAMLRLKAAQSA